MLLKHEFEYSYHCEDLSITRFNRFNILQVFLHSLLDFNNS